MFILAGSFPGCFWRRRLIFWPLLIFCALVAAAWHVTPVFAQESTPEAPGRKTILKIDVDQYEWLLNRWATNEAVCTIVVEHAGLPTLAEVANACGDSQAEDWMDTVPCGGESCDGVYLHLVRETRGQRDMEVVLPAPKAWISVTGCEPQLPDNRCSVSPELLISGEEPLPNEAIIRVQGIINGMPFSCPGSECVLAIPSTGIQGKTLEFWVESSFGDSSPHYTALVRIIAWGDFMAPEGRLTDKPLWFVDVLSSQWRGHRPASCAEVWQALPEVNGLPTWLTTPIDSSGLNSSISYYYLAGMLIQSGVVKAPNCPGGGLSMPQVANACGVQAALPDMVAWQNRFDEEILQTAKDTGVPAQLLKNIFSRESQLWPGMYRSLKEAGLGQMSERGADTAMLWNKAFFAQFCPLVFSQETCDKGFGRLSEDEQSILRGALVRKVNAACTDCPAGIDLAQADYSVRVFAQTLLANCQQVAQTYQNITSRAAGDRSSYEDLWRLTLVNYNAGAGCLAEAINSTQLLGQPLTWENVSGQLEGICADTIRYVEDISSVGMEPTTAPTSWLIFSTPGPAANPVDDRHPEATRMPGSAPIPDLQNSLTPGMETTPVPNSQNH